MQGFVRKDTIQLPGKNNPKDLFKNYRFKGKKGFKNS